MTAVDRLHNYIEGRSVAIVGRAEYLNQLEQGELIDSHEVVIRVHSNLPWPSPPFKLQFEGIDNNQSFVPMEFLSILGAKTTAFAPTNMPYWSVEDCDTIVPELMGRGCQCLIQHKIYNLVEPHGIAVIDYIVDKYKIDIVMPDYQQFVNLVRRMDYSLPMPGTILIDWIIRCRPKILYFTGFACYQDAQDKWLKANVKMNRDHKPLYDLRVLCDLVNQHNHITVDQELVKLFDNI